MIKLHLGCGGVYKEGYTNIDFYSGDGKVDRVFDCSQPLDYETNSIDGIECYHLFEHLPFNCIDEVVRSWYRVLKRDKKLIMELPNLDELIKGLVNKPNDDNLLKWLFGSQERTGQQHFWGWNGERLHKLLTRVGFREVKFTAPQDYHRDLGPCLRVEATK